MRMFANQADQIKENSHYMNTVKLQRTFKMGKVCKVCDRKFFIRASLENYANEIEFYEEQAEKVEDELYDKEDILCSITG